MLRTKIVREYVPYSKEVNVNVVEHKAPTDESVKLLNELQEKAMENIVHKLNIDDNFIKCEGIYFVDHVSDWNIHIHIKFEINGEEYYIKEKIDRSKWTQERSKTYMGFGDEGIYNMFCNKLGQIISKHLISQQPDILKHI